MKALLILLPVLCIVAGIAIGRATANTGLGRKDQRELQAYRNQQHALHSAAASGMELSEGTGYRVHDILEATRKAVSGK